MSRFDLNNPKDYQRVTSSALGSVGEAAGILQNFLGGGTEWDIQEAEYKGIKFHIFESKTEGYNASLDQIQDSGGRRKIKYTYPYQDGQTTDDLGRKAGTYTFNVLIHGNKYLTLYKKLMNVLNDPTSGTLVHPVLGILECVMEDFTVLHKSTERKAMTLSLTMIEHNFDTVTLDNLFEDMSVKSKLAQALDGLKTLERVILSVQGTVIFVTSIKNQITSFLGGVKTNYALMLSKMNQTYNSGQGGSSNDIPSLLPTNQGGTIDSSGNVVTPNFQIAASPNDPYQSIPVADLTKSQPIAFTTQQLEKEVNAIRDQINTAIQMLKKTVDSSLEFYQETLDLKATAVYLQEVLEAGKASSKAQLTEYTVPRLMTIRELAFANGIDIKRTNEIEILNPELDSVNYITQGTIVKVPT